MSKVKFLTEENRLAIECHGKTWYYDAYRIAFSLKHGENADKAIIELPTNKFNNGDIVKYNSDYGIIVSSLSTEVKLYLPNTNEYKMIMPSLWGNLPIMTVVKLIDDIERENLEQINPFNPTGKKFDYVKSDGTFNSRLFTAVNGRDASPEEIQKILPEKTTTAIETLVSALKEVINSND